MLPVTVKCRILVLEKTLLRVPGFQLLPTLIKSFQFQFCRQCNSGSWADTLIPVLIRAILRYKEQ